MPGFTHLHCHSEYSLLDGLARVPDLVSTAKKRGFEALALTDHGVMYGAVQFYKAAKKAGIKPIIGCELYVAKRSRHDRESAKIASPTTLRSWPRIAVGYRNLLKLVSRAQLEGFYYKPRCRSRAAGALFRGPDRFLRLSGCRCASADHPRTI